MRKIQIASFFIVFLIICSQLFSQEVKTIKGTIFDSSDSSLMPFASVNLQQQLSGTMTDGRGNFEINLDSANQEDTLIIQFLGYERRKIKVDHNTDKLVISLKIQAVQLSEVNVYPKSAAHYLQIAFSKELENAPEKAYNTYSYFRQELEENAVFIDKKELYLKTFYPEDKDSLKKDDDVDITIDKVQAQTQLLLYRKNQFDNEIQFGKKKYEKKKKKAEKKGNEIETPTNITSNIIDSLFGGPKFIIEAAKGNDRALDEQETVEKRMEELTDDYTLEFSDKTTEETMVIKAISKKKFKGQPTELNFYHIDIATDGFVAIETETYRGIPFIAKPILLILGVGVESIRLSWTQQNIEINDKWYPNNIILDLSLDVTKKYLLKANEKSIFKIKQALANNKIILNNASEISEEYRFDSNIKYVDQLYNTENVKWEAVNTIP